MEENEEVNKLKFKIAKIGLWPLKIKIAAAVTAGIIIIGGVSAAVVLNNKPTDSNKKASSENSSVVAPKYTTSVAEDGTVVVVDNEGNTVDNAEITEDGSIVIKNDKGEITESISGDNVKKYEEVKNEENKSENKPNNPESKPSESKPTESNQSGGSTEPGDSGKHEESKPSESKPEASGDSDTLAPLSNEEIRAAEEYFLQLVNNERINIGVQPLTRDTTLNKAANIRVKETFVQWGHTRPNGTNFTTVFKELKYGTPYEDIWSDDGINWNKDINYDYGAAGENLAGDYNSRKRDYKIIVDSFFSNLRYSPGHYKNMINAAYTKTGISIHSIVEDNQVKCNIIQVFTSK